jgi:hypothetical protein
VLARLAAAWGDNAAADRFYKRAAERDQHAGGPAWVLRNLRHHSNFLRTTGQHERTDVVAQRADRLARAITRATSGRL